MLRNNVLWVGLETKFILLLRTFRCTRLLLLNVFKLIRYLNKIFAIPPAFFSAYNDLILHLIRGISESREYPGHFLESYLSHYLLDTSEWVPNQLLFQKEDSPYAICHTVAFF